MIPFVVPVVALPLLLVLLVDAPAVRGTIDDDDDDATLKLKPPELGPGAL